MFGIGPMAGQAACAQGPAVILNVSPASGLKTGGTAVTLYGLNLDASVGTPTFNGANATSPAYVDRHSMTCTTPAAAFPWLDDVIVSTSKRTARLHSAFDRLQSGPIVAVDPANLPNSGYYIDYPGGAGSWPSVLGATDLGNRPVYFDQTIGRDAFPTAGTAVNGFAPAVFNGTTQALDTSPYLSSYIYGGDIGDLETQPYGVSGSGGFTAMVLVWVTSAAAPSAAAETDPGIWADASGYPVLGLTFSTNGAQAVAYDGTRRSCVMACSTGAWHLIILRCSSTQMSLRIDGVEASTPSTIDLDSIAAIMGIGQPVTIGKNPYVAFQPCQILAIGFIGRRLSDAECDGSGAYLQTKFALSLGITGSAADPSTFSRCTFWYASYLGSSQPWAGTKRTNNANGNTLSSRLATVPGTSTLNGFPTAVLNGVDTAFQPLRLTKDMLGTNDNLDILTAPYPGHLREADLGWTMHYIVKFNTLPLDGGIPYVNPCLFTDPQAVVGIGVSSDSGVQAFNIDAVEYVDNYVVTPAATAVLAAGTWGSIQARWNGTNQLEARLGPGAWQGVTCRPECYPTGAGRPYFGCNYTGGVVCDAQVAAIVISQRPYTTYTLDGIGFFHQQRYATNLGFPIAGSGSLALSPLVAPSTNTAKETFSGTGSLACSSLVAPATNAGKETFSGTGSLACSPLVGATGTGAETFTGTGSLACSPLVAPATNAGKETFSGTAALALSTLVCPSATGAETFSGTGSLACSPLVGATGTGSELFTGTGSLACSPLVGSATGAETFSATGSLALSPLVAPATNAAKETFSGTGSLACSPLVGATGTGAETFSGTASMALSPLVCAATGAEAFSGACSMTLSPLVGSCTAAETFSGTGALALSPLDSSGTGNTGAVFTGTCALALSPLSGSASGAESFAGTCALALSPLVGAGTGGEDFTGTAALALSPLACSGSGAETFTGTASLALSPLLGSASGSEAFSGTGSLALSPLSSSAAGVQGFFFTGIGALSLSPLSASGTAAETFSGTGSLALSPLAMALTGAETFSGSAALTLSSLSLAGFALNLAPVTGTASLALSPLSGAGTASETFSGAASLALSSLVAGATAAEVFSGSVLLTLSPLSALVAAHNQPLPVTGTASLALSPLSASASAAEVFSGSASLALGRMDVTGIGFFIGVPPPEKTGFARLLFPRKSRASVILGERALATVLTTAKGVVRTGGIPTRGTATVLLPPRARMKPKP